MEQQFKKILLVYPEIPANTFWSFKYALRFLKKKSAMPPLGLITVAALFPDSYELKLVDMNVESLKEKDIQWADAVFISAMMIQKKSFEEVVNRCRQLSKIVVAGGPHITTSYQEIQGVDHFLLGEVEDTFSTFLEEWQQGQAKKIYPLIKRPEMTHSVLPRFDLLKMNAYASMSVQYSRGCPFNCEFCDIWKVYGRTPRLKTPASLMVELDQLYRLGWRGSVFFVDDNFVGNKAKVRDEMLPALLDWQKRHDFVYRFYTQSSLNMAEDNILMTEMNRVGFNSVFLGIETPCEKSLEETGKFQNLKSSMLKAIQKIQHYGMEVMGGFIVGFDNDTESIFDRQIEFIQKAGIPKAMVGLLNAMPGTDLFNRLKKENRLLNYVLSGSNTHHLKTNFITKMSSENLVAGYKKVLEFLYGKHLKNYFQRCNQMLDNVATASAPLFQRKVRFADLQILVKSFFVQSCSAYGFQYLKFIIRNFVKHRKIFSEAVCMAIEGHHFYKITKEVLSPKLTHELF